MERIASRSRDIAIVGYENDKSILEIAFRSGGVYHYQGVPGDVYQDLLTAPSQGIFFEEKIKHQYPYQRIR